MYALWAVLLVGGVLVDVKSGALVGVWVALGALGGAAAAMLGLPPILQLFAFALLAALLLLLVRPVALRYRSPRLIQPSLLIGKFATVLDPVTEELASGRVLVEGVPYVARCRPGQEPIAPGAVARICGVEAGDVLVERN